MVSSTFTMLYNHYYYLVLELFRYLKDKPVSTGQSLLIPLSLMTTNLLSVSMNCQFRVFHINGITFYVAYCV